MTGLLFPGLAPVAPAQAEKPRKSRAVLAPFPFRLDGYGTIFADPPWHFEDQAGRMRCPYPTMTDEEILEMPVGDIAAAVSHLWLWCTDAHLELGLACVRAWGFVFKRTVPWIKTTLDGTRLRIGGGHTLRGAHELALFATRGDRVYAGAHNVPTVQIAAPRGEHSEKPPELYEAAEALSPAPRIELFARGEARPGWVAWGNQAAPSAEVITPSRGEDGLLRTPWNGWGVEEAA